MTRAAYRQITVGMRFRKVRDIINYQKPALYTTMSSAPALLYRGCAWTQGKGVGLLYQRDLFAPLGSSTLTRKYLNYCGLVFTCM